MNEALVTPKNTPWMDGPSTVEPTPTGKALSNVPLRNYMETDVQITSNAFPNGHVLIVRGNPPPTIQAVLPVLETAQTSLTVKGLGARPYEYGVVVIFK